MLCSSMLQNDVISPLPHSIIDITGDKCVLITILSLFLSEHPNVLISLFN